MAQYRTLREIAKRMRWSPSTVLRRHKLDEFPLYLDWTPRGLIWVTSDRLIELWEQGKVEMCKGARLRYPRRRWRKTSYRPYNWRLRGVNRTHNGTVRPTIPGGSGSGYARAVQTQSAPVAGKERPTLREELDQLTPAEREWIIKNELTPAQCADLGVTVTETCGTPAGSQPPEAPAKKTCTCGTPTPCTAH